MEAHMSTAFAHPRLLSIVVLLALTISAGGADPPAVEWQTDYQLAHKSRLQRQKPMIVYITMDGCLHCNRMLKTSYKNQQVAGKISDGYVATIINGTHQEDLAKQFGVRIYPTTFLVGPDNRIVDKMEGYVAAKELHRRLNVVSHYYSQLARTKGAEAR